MASQRRTSAVRLDHVLASNARSEADADAAGLSHDEVAAVLARMEDSEAFEKAHEEAMESKGGNLVVAVRSRPLNTRERAADTKVILRMSDTHVSITDPDDETKTNDFAFDFAFWSSAAEHSGNQFASQQTVFSTLGVQLLCSAWQGFNCTIFAYGQTGSGKSYSMSGADPNDRSEWGLVPRVCFHLFEMVAAVGRRSPQITEGGKNVEATVEASFLEIHNEQVLDLLSADRATDLKVRELKGIGVFVQGLHKSMVHNFAAMLALMDEGNRRRTVAATNMNATSSRSHSIFTIELKIVTTSTVDGVSNKSERNSKINLCDLAGSERASRTGAAGARLKEGAQINTSLSALGRCIKELASAGGAVSTPGTVKRSLSTKGSVGVVPFRESKLTYLLKDSLSGNAKTLMLAALSPAGDSYSETISTLRYAYQAKSIKTKAVVNQTPAQKLIAGYQREIERLKAAAAAMDVSHPAGGAAGGGGSAATAEVMEELEAYKAQMSELKMTNEEKKKRTEEVNEQRRSAMEDGGLSVEELSAVFDVGKDTPHLINLSEDTVSLGEALVYFLPAGDTVVGTREEASANIKLDGDDGSIKARHAVLTNAGADGNSISIRACSSDASVHVNGELLVSPGDGEGGSTELAHNARVVLGGSHFYRFVHPAQAHSSPGMSALDAKQLMEEIAARKAEQAAAEATAVAEAKGKKLLSGAKVSGLWKNAVNIQQKKKLREEVAAGTSELAMLKSELDSSETLFQALQEQFAKVCAQLTVTQEELKSANATAGELHLEAERIKLLEAQLAENASTLASLAVGDSDLQGKLSAVQREATARATLAEEEAETANEIVGTLEEEKGELERRLAVAEEARAAAEEEADAASEIAGVLESEKNELEGANAQLKERLAAAEEEAEAAGEVAGTIQSEADALREQLARAEERLAQEVAAHAEARREAAAQAEDAAAANSDGPAKLKRPPLWWSKSIELLSSAGSRPLDGLQQEELFAADAAEGGAVVAADLGAGEGAPALGHADMVRRVCRAMSFAAVPSDAMAAPSPRFGAGSGGESDGPSERPLSESATATSDGDESGDREQQKAEVLRTSLLSAVRAQDEGLAAALEELQAMHAKLAVSRSRADTATRRELQLQSEIDLLHSEFDAAVTVDEDASGMAPAPPSPASAAGSSSPRSLPARMTSLQHRLRLAERAAQEAESALMGESRLLRLLREAELRHKEQMAKLILRVGAPLDDAQADEGSATAAKAAAADTERLVRAEADARAALAAQDADSAHRAAQHNAARRELYRQQQHLAAEQRARAQAEALRQKAEQAFSDQQHELQMLREQLAQTKTVRDELLLRCAPAPGRSAG